MARITKKILREDFGYDMRSAMTAGFSFRQKKKTKKKRKRK